MNLKCRNSSLQSESIQISGIAFLFSEIMSPSYNRDYYIAVDYNDIKSEKSFGC